MIPHCHYIKVTYKNIISHAHTEATKEEQQQFHAGRAYLLPRRHFMLANEHFGHTTHTTPPTILVPSPSPSPNPLSFSFFPAHLAKSRTY